MTKLGDLTVINKKCENTFFDISLEENFYILSLTQIGIKNTQIAVKLGKNFFTFLLLFFGFILKNHVFHFDSLIKKIFSLEAYLKSAGFKDKGEGFPKNLFSILKDDRRRRLKKTANLFIKIFEDEFKNTVKTFF